MPVTRSQAKSASASADGASAQPSDTKVEPSDPVREPSLSIFADLADDSLLHGRDAKAICDATTTAIEQVWNDTCATTASLTRKINESNAALQDKLKESFAAVGKRLDNLPTIAMLQSDSPALRVLPFSGVTENGVQFSIWLRRLEDVMRMRPAPLTDEQRANFLIGHLDGVAREKVEELDDSAKKSYSSVVSHLLAFFESPHQRYVARQQLAACRQEAGESCTSFANRVLNLVRAATSGQDPSTQKDRVLEEFVSRLRGDIRYFVKLDGPLSFEQAVNKAQTVEQLLSEATAERLLHSTSTPAPVQVLRSSPGRGPPPLRAPPRSPLRTRAPNPVHATARPRRAPSPPRSSEFRCYNCSGFGHFAGACPSPRRQGSLPSQPVARSPFPNRSQPAPARSYNAQAFTVDPLSDVATLSASLRDSQDQLQRSQARVSALLRRNEELTQASLERPVSPPRPTSSVLPDIRALFCVVLCLTVFASPELGTTPAFPSGSATPTTPTASVSAERDSPSSRAFAQTSDTFRAPAQLADTSTTIFVPLTTSSSITLGKFGPSFSQDHSCFVSLSYPLLDPDEIQHLTLASAPSTSTVSQPSTSSDISSAHVRPSTDTFSTFRESTLSSPPSRSAAASHSTEAPSPAKRARTTAATCEGIQPHPAYPPRWERTPDNFRSPFAALHPWGRYVEERRRLPQLQDNQVTSVLPLHAYRHIPCNGYFASRFVRSLFPRRFAGIPSPQNPIPVMELMKLQNIISFRQHAAQLTTELLDDSYRDDTEDIRRIPWTTPGAPIASCLVPPSDNNQHPFLYQVVARGYGQGVILEAKDFFIPGPDLRELHCVPLVQDSVNLRSGTRGFDTTQVSVKDLVWVYSLRPTQATIRSQDRARVLKRARLPRASRFDVTLPYFFRVHEYVWVTPTPSQRHLMGIVLAVHRRGEHGEVNTAQVAFQGCREAVRISPSICEFNLNDLERDELLFSEARENVSCAMRFCVPAVSVAAQRFLLNAVRFFIPSHPDEAILPLRVYRPTQQQLDWIADRQGDFSSYNRHTTAARRRMDKLFAAASAALAAQSVLLDDKRTHEVTAFVPSLTALPVRLQIELSGMTSEAG